MAELWLTKKDLATAFGVTTRAIEQFQVMAGFPQPRREARSNLYSLPDAVSWFIDHRIGQRIGEGDDGEEVDLTRERALLARSQRRHRDLLYERDAGRLIDIDFVVKAWLGILQNVRARLLAMPPKLGPLVGIEENPSACRQIVEREVHQVLTELAEEPEYGP